MPPIYQNVEGWWFFSIFQNEDVKKYVAPEGGGTEKGDLKVKNSFIIGEGI